MLTKVREQGFDSINTGYNAVFQPSRLSLGLVVPLERYADESVPSMERHIERVKLAEELDFSSVWLRDVPFNVPSFGDAGHIYDPFVYLGLLAGQTKQIALGVASIILPLRHPAHVAKAAASVDQLSGGRLILGIASGDRPDEYPALGVAYPDRGKRFRDSYEYIRQMASSSPDFTNDFGQLNGEINLLPRPESGKLPMLITGASQQSPDWLAKNGDGWMTYPRDIALQQQNIKNFRAESRETSSRDKPVMQPLYVDLAEDSTLSPQPIHLGYRLGSCHLTKHLKELESIGVNHVALNLRFNRADIETSLKRLADDVLPHFS